MPSANTPGASRTARLVLTVPALITLFGPAWAELNDSHAFNPDWSPHARYHSVANVQTHAAAGVAACWLLWARSTSQAQADARITAAALLPALLWLPLLPAALVPGVAVEDAPGDTPRVAGLPLNLLCAALMPLGGLAGLALHRRQRRAAARARAGREGEQPGGLPVALTA